MDWEKRITELAREIIYHDRKDAAEVHLRDFKQEVERDLIRQGMGDPPVSEERVQFLHDMRQYGQAGDLFVLIDFLVRRIAFLASLGSDNQAWADGYRRGLEDGKAEAIRLVMDLMNHPRWQAPFASNSPGLSSPTPDNARQIEAMRADVETFNRIISGKGS